MSADNLARKHQDHWSLSGCNCLGDSAICCDEDCECRAPEPGVPTGDNAEPVAPDGGVDGFCVCDPGYGPLNPAPDCGIWAHRVAARARREPVPAVHPEGTGDDLRARIDAAVVAALADSKPAWKVAWDRRDGVWNEMLMEAQAELAAERAGREAAEAEAEKRLDTIISLRDDREAVRARAKAAEQRAEYAEHRANVLCAEVRAAEQRLAAVLALHAPLKVATSGGVIYRERELIPVEPTYETRCAPCRVPYPCPTARAAGLTPEAQQ